jgi:hyperosmotically inducible protein
MIGMLIAVQLGFERRVSLEKTGGIKMKTKYIIMTIGLSALAFAGCESAPPNSNVSLKNTNSNQAVVINSNTKVPATTNTPRRDGANVSREEYDKNKADYEKDKRSGETIGQGINDSWLWTKTRAALLTTSELRESTINVDVVNDVVTLKGTVASAAEKTKAETVAKGIDGVKSVKNELKVEPKDSMTNQAINGSTTPAKTNPASNKK